VAGRLGYGGGGVIGGIGAGGFGPSNTSTRSAAPGQLYGSKVKQGAGNMGVHHWLWVLVAIEMGILFVLRAVVFKSYHGG
jgi:hypothetical protein